MSNPLNSLAIAAQVWLFWTVIVVFLRIPAAYRDGDHVHWRSLLSRSAWDGALATSVVLAAAVLIAVDLVLFFVVAVLAGGCWVWAAISNRLARAARDGQWTEDRL